MIRDLTKFSLVYLATPYSKYRDGLDCAFRDAAALTAKLLKLGLKVYSPIAHTHPIALYGEIDPLDHSIWLPFEERLMALADALLVAQMNGWRESYGINHEIQFFTAAGKPVFYLDCMLMQAARVPHGFRAFPIPTETDLAAQRRSWEVGETMLAHPEMSREQAEALVDSVIEGSAPQGSLPSPDANESRNELRG